MANIIGKIVSGNGSFFIKHPDGTLEVAKVGSTLFEVSDKLIGSSSNSNENSSANFIE
jgi:hypothetical protein